MMNCTLNAAPIESLQQHEWVTNSLHEKADN